MQRNRRRPRRSKQASAQRVASLRIAELGANADGVADWNGARGYIPFTAPGDVIEADLQPGSPARGQLVRIEHASDLRQAPACPHFGRCGGCAIQHLEPTFALDWKRGVVVKALTHHGFEDAEALVEPTRPTQPGGRRRAAVKLLRKSETETIVGFNARGSKEILDVTSCPVLSPVLFDWLAVLRAQLAPLLPLRLLLRFTITETLSGADIVMTGPRDLEASLRLKLAEWAADMSDLAALSWQSDDGDFAEPLFRRHEAQIEIAGYTVALPPGGFLQASKQSEALLSDLVTSAMPDEKCRVLDLFSGCGTFSLALARKQHKVLAIEGLEASIAALRQTAGSHGLPITAEVRDLERSPPTAKEMKKYDAAVFDPPRSGCRAVAEALAQSGPRHLVAVSCNPASFARDARTLCEAGYRLEKVTPIDQFVWSDEVELVAVLHRSKTAS